mgnify:CR=1 FL=1
MSRLKNYLLLAAMMLICSLAGAEEYNSEGYLQVTGPCGLEFPRDHGAHPGYRTEWWYYTGNLKSVDGRHFGFQLTLFRRQIKPSEKEGDPVEPNSAWRTSQVYFGHVALTDIKRGRHRQAENIARGALGLAGSVQLNGATTIWLHNWSIQIDPDAHNIFAETPEFRIRLKHTPLKPPVLHGEKGYSRRGEGPGQAGCYYSITRMNSGGELTVDGRSFPVSGQSWMDHDFSTTLLEPGTVGWDWFSLQLSDDSEIMFYLLRTEDGALHPASSGTFVDRQGKSTHLERGAISVFVLDRWKSPVSGAVYPSRWRVKLSFLDIDLVIASNLPDQEMKTLQTTGTIYWEGSVSVVGQSGGQKVNGAGFVELTGYARPFGVPE